MVKFWRKNVRLQKRDGLNDTSENTLDERVLIVGFFFFFETRYATR